ncbi:MAG TPA: hypothetical protein VEP66_18330 [Myxococcales bacterium]|nr:hypothetical protein [Myxococcales bacterium]
MGEFRAEVAARRLRALRSHRRFKLIESVACILGLVWVAMLLGSILSRPPDPKMAYAHRSDSAAGGWNLPGRERIRQRPTH